MPPKRLIKKTMNNKQQAENFLDLAKETYPQDKNLAEWRLKVAKVHALLALDEAIHDSKYIVSGM